ncbi:hypothetical protein P152DRAFT_465317 [Eremomyces bilateralis CBS 781.70]|uniref:BZIP domain-containing protein n=1 Tax=Eremomyces bilateralis CBS 781.70 TaxID=1392243 RepID=A0A6G1G9A3_9PEZI|nr:uncharacterized protein P152DRAFT_465317 [Eremomyces bilateralis CBS 781.70]KAF1814481.1 hypothetical protein P152DRAFT_465317 [Eremomyces bilateralis CBS 781.70]
MDYSTYFTASSQQPYPLVGIQATTYPLSTDDGQPGSNVHEAVDPTSFLAYDAFRFTPTPGPLHSTSPPTAASPPAPSATVPLNADDTYADPLDTSQRLRSSSEEDKETTITPAQSRRKAQNRTAQRAFRERKERHVKTLESKLTAMETSATSLAIDNDRLKLALQRATTENEILRTTTSHSALQRAGHAQMAGSHQVGHGPGSPGTDHEEDTTNSGTRYMAGAARRRKFGSSGTVKDGKETLLSLGQVWDVIQSHPLVQQGLVDVADVCERLRGAARSNGVGAGFREKEVWGAVEGCRRGGGDQLI